MIKNYKITKLAQIVSDVFFYFAPPVIFSAGDLITEAIKLLREKLSHPLVIIAMTKFPTHNYSWDYLEASLFECLFSFFFHLY